MKIFVSAKRKTYASKASKMQAPSPRERNYKNTLIFSKYKTQGCKATENASAKHEAQGSKATENLSAKHKAHGSEATEKARAKHEA